MKLSMTYNNSMSDNNEIKTAKELERIIWLDEQLRAKRPFNSASALEKYRNDFGINTDRTIKSDISRMQTYFGAPIEYDYTKRTYFYTDDTFFLPSVLLDDGDIFGLVLAEQLLEQYENSPIYDTLSNGFSKIRTLMKGASSVDPFWFSKKITVIEPVQSFIEPDQWTQIHDALKENRVLAFHYVRADGVSGRRKVEPYNLIGHRGSWYIIGKAHGSNPYNEKYPIRVYSMSRMKNLKATTTRFSPDKDFKLEKHIDPELGVYISNEKHDIEVAFSPDAKVYIEERFWHSTFNLEVNDDGSSTLRFTTNQLDEAFRLLLPFLHMGTVISPPELKERVIAFSEQLSRNNSA